MDPRDTSRDPSSAYQPRMSARHSAPVPRTARQPSIGLSAEHHAERDVNRQRCTVRSPGVACAQAHSASAPRATSALSIGPARPACRASSGAGHQPLGAMNPRGHLCYRAFSAHNMVCQGAVTRPSPRVSCRAGRQPSHGIKPGVAYGRLASRCTSRALSIGPALSAEPHAGTNRHEGTKPRDRLCYSTFIRPCHVPRGRCHLILRALPAEPHLGRVVNGQAGYRTGHSAPVPRTARELSIGTPYPQSLMWVVNRQGCTKSRGRLCYSAQSAIPRLPSAVCEAEIFFLLYVRCETRVRRQHSG